jgi:hypothetical protein
LENIAGKNSLEAAIKDLNVKGTPRILADVVNLIKMNLMLKKCLTSSVLIQVEMYL